MTRTEPQKKRVKNKMTFKKSIWGVLLLIPTIAYGGYGWHTEDERLNKRIDDLEFRVSKMEYCAAKRISPCVFVWAPGRM
jgi:hypothetical protein